MSNRVLARAMVKVALAEDKKTAINAANSAQAAGCEVYKMKELTPAEAKELKIWIDMKVHEHELQA